MHILVLGGGHQGQMIAQELAQDFTVTVADVRSLDIPKVTTKKIDLSDFSSLVELLKNCDLAVGALPAALGFNAAKAAVAAKRHYVDLSFYPEDVYALDSAAKEAGVAILPDCGLAPGLSNLVVGRALSEKKYRHISIEVGGVARDRNAPYGYVVSWALSDLVDEYTRPARFKRNGKIQTLPALSELELVKVGNLGPFESFLTDGCRTLLRLDIDSLVEKTLRWPGHVESIQPLLKNHSLIETFKKECQKGDDMVVMRIVLDDQEKTLIDYAQKNMSAMARTTALTCAGFTRLLASGKIQQTGVLPPEVIGQNKQAYDFIMNHLKSYAIAFNDSSLKNL